MDSNSVIILSSGDECMSDDDVFLFPAQKFVEDDAQDISDADLEVNGSDVRGSVETVAKAEKSDE